MARFRRKQRYVGAVFDGSENVLARFIRNENILVYFRCMNILEHFVHRLEKKREAEFVSNCSVIIFLSG